MKRILSIWLSLFVVNLYAQNRIDITIGNNYAKNVSYISPIDSGYRAFGFIENTSPTATQKPTRLTYFCRVGADHLNNGFAKYVNYDIQSRTWGNWTSYDDDPMPDHRDTWGGRTDDDSVIMFGQQTWNNINNNTVSVASTANVTLSGLQTIDGVTLSIGDTVLAKDQTTASQNGVYIVSASAWGRASFFDTWTEVVNATATPTRGTQASTVFLSTSASTGTIGITSITFTTTTTPHDWRSIDIYFRKVAVSDFGISSKTSIFSAFPSLIKLFRGVVFGHLSHGAAMNEFYITLFQWNDDPTLPPPKRYLIQVLHTTNNFRSGNSVMTIVDGTNNWTEGCVSWLGNNKLAVFLRNSSGGKIDVSFTSDGGSSWTAPLPSNLGYYGIQVEIPFVYKYKNKFNIIYQDRNSGMICLSRANDTANFFNNRLNFNSPEIWADNSSTTTLGNAALGYPSQTVLDTSNDIFMNCWAYEDTNTRAHINYTVSKIDKSTGNADAPPLIHPSFITSTSFRIDLLNLTSGMQMGAPNIGYTPQQMQNISYFIYDVATDPDFTVFPIIKWGYVLDAPSPVHNFRLPATWMSLNNLTANTTYYIRIKAVNFNGESSYTTTTVTTLP